MNSTQATGIYQGPTLESADFKYVMHNNGFTATTTVIPATANQASRTIAEFVIPYMHIQRFLGLASAPNASYFQSHLGWLAIGLNAVPTASSTTGTYTVNNVVIMPYVGCEDTGRFMYQTISNIFQLRNVSGFQDSVYQGPLNDTVTLPSGTAPTYFVGLGVP